MFSMQFECIYILYGINKTFNQNNVFWELLCIFPCKKKDDLFGLLYFLFNNCRK